MERDFWELRSRVLSSMKGTALVQQEGTHVGVGAQQLHEM